MQYLNQKIVVARVRWNRNYKKINSIYTLNNSHTLFNLFIKKTKNECIKIK